MLTSLQHKRVAYLTALLTLTLSVLLPSQLSAKDFTYKGFYFNVLDENARTVAVTGHVDQASGGSGSLILPETVKDNSTGVTYTLVAIDDGAFCDYDGFTGTLTIPNSVTYIGVCAFTCCSGLTGTLTIPNSVTEIGEAAFSGCGGFTGSLTIPNSVTAIGADAFDGCSGFTGSLIIGNSLTEINETMFRGCGGFTGSLIIGNSVTTIGNNAFSGCTGFTGTLTIPNSVTTIGNNAFSGCTGFTGTLTIPNSVTTIGNNAFSGCTGFTGTLTIPNSVTTIGNNAFSGCTGFTGSLTIPNSVTKIGVSAFWGCSGFTGSLIIGNSVDNIGNYAFYDCSGFSELIIGNSVTSVDYYAFENCSNLEWVCVTATTPPTADSNAFSDYNCPLYVYSSSMAAYSSAQCWNRFTTRHEIVNAETIAIDGKSEYGGVKPGDTFKLTATVSPADATIPYIFWRSTNPDFASVDNNGNVTIHDFDQATYSASGMECEIIAETFYADGPVAKVTIRQEQISGIEDIPVDKDGMQSGQPNDIYNLQGICLKRNASQDDIDALAPGLYIIGGKKVHVK